MPIHLVIKKKGKENFDECDFHAIYFGTFVCVVLVKHLVESCETTGSKLRGLVCRQKVCRCLSHVGRVCWSRWERCGLGDPHSIRSIYTLVWGTIIDPFFLVGQPVSYHFKAYTYTHTLSYAYHIVIIYKY